MRFRTQGLIKKVDVWPNSDGSERTTARVAYMGGSCSVGLGTPELIQTVKKAHEMNTQCDVEGTMTAGQAGKWYFDALTITPVKG